MYNSKVSDSVLDLGDKTESRFEVVDEIVDIGSDHQELFFRVKWGDLPDELDFTWNPIKDLHEGIPDKVTTFLTITSKKN